MECNAQNVYNGIVKKFKQSNMTSASFLGVLVFVLSERLS